MPHLATRSRKGLGAPSLITAAVRVFGVAASIAPAAQADAVAYLVNVTVRSGHNFANADAALAYGRCIRDKVAAGRGYDQIIGYQGSYLIAQAVNELCPSLIWQLRSSAARYRPPAA